MEKNLQGVAQERLLVQGPFVQPNEERDIREIPQKDEAQASRVGNSADLMEHLEALVSILAKMPDEDRIEALNTIKRRLHEVSPFAKEPVDCVIWVPAHKVEANDYNPNRVAPPEMKLLQHSIRMDGYTQPIVVYDEDHYYEVVDGFHRNRVGKECPDIRERVRGYLPVVLINQDRTDRCDRIAATIRHNRARGKHVVMGMADIVLELSRRNWSDKKIARELGMEPDEVLRLKQITGLAELFADKEFSEAWEAASGENDYETDDEDQLAVPEGH